VQIQKTKRKGHQSRLLKGEGKGVSPQARKIPEARCHKNEEGLILKNWAFEKNKVIHSVRQKSSQQKKTNNCPQRKRGKETYGKETMTKNRGTRMPQAMLFSGRTKQILHS